MKLVVINVLILAVVNGLVFHCNFIDADWPDVGAASIPSLHEYACVNPDITSSEDRALTDVQGEHKSSSANINVRILFVNGDSVNISPERNISKFPHDVGKAFQHLVGLGWVNMNLTSISENDLKGFAHLRVLDFRNNRITSLDGNLLQSTRRLVSIGFRSNWIEFIGLNFLDNLSELEVADFQSNFCVTESAQNETDMVRLMNNLRKKCSPPPETTSTTTPTPKMTPTPEVLKLLQCKLLH
jgi:hypothetical protein